MSNPFNKQTSQLKKRTSTNKLKLNRSKGKKVSIKVENDLADKLLNDNCSKNHKETKTYQFSETVTNLKENKKDEKAIWISRRGSINFHTMENQDHVISF